MWNFTRWWPVLVLCVSVVAIGAVWPPEWDPIYSDFGMRAMTKSTAVGALQKATNKFGCNLDLDTADGTETVWDGASDVANIGDYPWPASAQTLYISSTNAGDVEEIEISGLDANWVWQTETATLAGLTFTAVTGTWIRVNRAHNAGDTNTVGKVYVHTDSTDGNADGIPDDPSTQVLAIVSAGAQQTEMTLYSVAAGKRGLLDSFCWGTGRQSGAQTREADFNLQVREFGGVFRTRWDMVSHNQGNTSQCVNLKYPFLIPEKSDIRIRAKNASANDTAAFAQFSILEVPENWY